MKSLHNNETPQSALGGKERRNVAGFLSIQSNEIYDYGAKVEWGSIDHRGSRVKRSFFRFRKKKGGTGAGSTGVFYGLWGTLNPKGGLLATPSQVVQVEATLEDCPLDQFSAAFLTRISSLFFFALFLIISSRVTFPFF